jgi:hypothetical protein
MAFNGLSKFGLRGITPTLVAVSIKLSHFLRRSCAIVDAHVVDGANGRRNLHQLANENCK